MNSLRINCGPVKITGAHSLRGSDGRDDVPGWSCNSANNPACNYRAKKALTRMFGLGTYSELLLILMVLSSMLNTVSCRLVVYGDGYEKGSFKVENAHVAESTFLIDVGV